MTSYLQAENIGKSFGDLVLFENISFGIGKGQKISLVARNGAGKTTLLNILAGKEECNTGQVTARRDLRIAYLAQNPCFPAGTTVLEACFHGDDPVLKTIEGYEKALLEGDDERLGKYIPVMDALEAWDYEQKAKQILTRLRITDFDKNTQQLSGGQLKRVALANVLIAEADLLILDEPTNHLDLDMTEWLGQYLSSTGASLLMVTHDRYFLDTVSNEIIEIDNRQIYTYHGNYSHYLEKRSERIASAASRRESEINLFRKELDWMRRQPQARATKAKSRIDAFHRLEDKLRTPGTNHDLKLDLKASRIGTRIFEVRNLSKRYGDTCVLDNFSYTFSRFEKMGIVGNNGCGKSTFVKMIMGEVAPDSGTIDIGETVRFGYYSQTGLQFDEGMKVIDIATRIAEHFETGDGRSMSASQFLQYFLFPPAVQNNPVAKLSGGEKRRLYLCTVLMGSPNFLILDEPTNDLDILTLGVLEEYLRSFKGCLIVISHDRYFMDKTVDHLLAFTGEGRIKDFAGTYSQYIEWKHGYEESLRSLQQAARPQPLQRERKTAGRKLSFKEKREFEGLEAEITALELEKTELEAELDSGNLEIEELTRKSVRICELIGLIDEKTMRWLELAEIQ
ncbi:MAG: ABC-F family ATP-binding cassette domain-containing protein [Rikenellaceae bacterium]|nr:ABC-F family ATP-binding cassette domain-containing protein [Rikenellaceae bacterium]